MTDIAHFVWELYVFRVPLVLAAFVYAALIQLLWVNGRDQFAGLAVPNSLVREFDRLTCIWLAAELCGAALAVAGVQVETCLAIVLVLGFACSLPSYYRVGRRVVQTMPLLGWAARGTLDFVRRSAERLAIAASDWVNAPASVADCCVRVLLLTAELTAALVLALRFFIPHYQADIELIAALAACAGTLISVLTTAYRAPNTEDNEVENE